VLVTYSEMVSELSATNLSNYSIVANATGSPVPISGASLQANGSNVVLTTSTLPGGATFTLTINNVRDRSVAANQIAPNSTVTFNTVAGFTPVDIGTPPLAGSVTAADNGFDVSSSGADIGGSSDQLTFGYQQRTGDFDVNVRLAGLTLADIWSKAGLMARQSLNANSAYAAALSSPDSAGSFFQFRTTSGGATTNSGSAPVNYPSTWLRLQRSGSSFRGRPATASRLRALQCGNTAPPSGAVHRLSAAQGS